MCCDCYSASIERPRRRSTYRLTSVSRNYAQREITRIAFHFSDLAEVSERLCAVWPTHQNYRILHHHRNQLDTLDVDTLLVVVVAIDMYWSRAFPLIFHSFKNSQPSSDVKQFCIGQKPTLPPHSFCLPNTFESVSYRQRCERSQLSRVRLKSREATGAGLTVSVRRAFLQHKTGRVCSNADIEWGF